MTNALSEGVAKDPRDPELRGGQDRRLRETLTGIEHAPSGRANTNGNADAPSGHASSAANLLGRCRY
jgi:hypothetical protein